MTDRVMICEPDPDCKDPNINRWYCARGHKDHDGNKRPGVCPLEVCVRRGANVGATS